MPDTHSADALVFPVKPEIAAHAHVTAEGYRTMYERAARDPDGFWARGGEAHRLDEGADQGQEHHVSPATSRSNGSRTAR